MLILILLVANIPIYFFFGWLLFDTKENAAESFIETVVSILKAIFIPGIVRVMMGMETENAGGVLSSLLFLAACVAAICIEYWAITTYIWPDLAW